MTKKWFFWQNFGVGWGPALKYGERPDIRDGALFSQSHYLGSATDPVDVTEQASDINLLMKQYPKPETHNESPE